MLIVSMFAQEGVAIEQKSAAASKVGSTYKIDWQYQNFPLQVNIYYLQNPRTARIGGMGRLKSKVNTVLANRFASKDVFVPEGDIFKFAMAVENTTNKKVYFNVVPHEVIPEEFSLGTKFICACFGHIYSVAPGQIWYRIISLSNSTPKLGKNFSIQHKVIGVDINSTFSEAKEVLKD